MELQLHDWVDQHIYATGDFEDYTVQVFVHLLARGDTVVDIGANIGFFSILAAQTVGPEGLVIAFEPAPETRQRLERNLALNRIDNVLVRQEAVSDTDGEAVFFAGRREQSGGASLRAMSNSPSQYPVRVSRFDGMAWPHPSPRLVKIDIEGAELAALKGMAGLLRDSGPDLILEVTDSFLLQMGSSAQALTQYLFSFGYRCYMIDWDGLIPVDEWSTALPNQYNALFTRRAILPSGLRLKSN